MVIVDTSVLVDFFRGKTTPATTKFEQLEIAGISFAILGVCAQELLQGAKNAKDWKLLYNHVMSQKLLFPEDQRATHIEAARLFFDGRRKGLTIRNSTDCYIAQLVLEVDGTLLQDDVDFRMISKIRPLRLLSY